MADNPACRRASRQIDSNNARVDDAVESPGSADTGHPDGALLDPLKMEEIRADEWRRPRYKREMRPSRTARSVRIGSCPSPSTTVAPWITRSCIAIPLGVVLIELVPAAQHQPDLFRGR